MLLCLQEERQAKLSAAKSDPGQDLLGDEEVEAMRLQQEEDERRERIAAEVIKVPLHHLSTQMALVCCSLLFTLGRKGVRRVCEANWWHS